MKYRSYRQMKITYVRLCWLPICLSRGKKMVLCRELALATVVQYLLKGRGIGDEEMK